MNLFCYLSIFILSVFDVGQIVLLHFVFWILFFRMLVCSNTRFDYSHFLHIWILILFYYKDYEDKDEDYKEKIALREVVRSS